MLGGKIKNVVGYTDGSLFKMMKPSLANNRQAFIGRKNFASINAMIVSCLLWYIILCISQGLATIVIVLV